MQKSSTVVTDLIYITILVLQMMPLTKSPLMKLPRKMATQAMSLRKKSIPIINNPQRIARKQMMKMMTLSMIKTKQQK